MYSKINPVDDPRTRYFLFLNIFFSTDVNFCVIASFRSYAIKQLVLKYNKMTTHIYIHNLKDENIYKHILNLKINK